MNRAQPAMRPHRRSRRVALAALGAPTVASAQQELRSPDARDVTRAVAPAQDLRSPDVRDATAVHAKAWPSRPALVTAAREPSASGGADWSAVTIGGLGLLAALLCAGAFVIVRHARGGVATAVADGTRGWRRGIGL